MTIQHEGHSGKTPSNNGRDLRALRAEVKKLCPGLTERFIDSMRPDQLEQTVEEHRQRDAAPKTKSKPGVKEKAEGRFKTFRLFLDRGVPEAKLTLAEYAVWSCMWNEERHGYVQISFGQLTRQTPLSRHGVQKAVSSLQAKEMIRLVKKGNIQGACNRYMLSPFPNEKWKKVGLGDEVEDSAPYATELPTPMQLGVKTYATELPLPEESLQTRPEGRPADVRSGTARLADQAKLNSEETPPISPSNPIMSEAIASLTTQKGSMPESSPRFPKVDIKALAAIPGPDPEVFERRTRAGLKRQISTGLRRGKTLDQIEVELINAPGQDPNTADLLALWIHEEIQLAREVA